MDRVRKPASGGRGFQGSILSVTLFAIKISSLATVIPANIHTSLFVDDLQIAYQDYRMTDITAKLQNTKIKLKPGQPEMDSNFQKQKRCV